MQLLAEDMYNEITFNFELKAPAAWCLLAWQTSGLQVLLDSPQNLDDQELFAGVPDPQHTRRERTFTQPLARRRSPGARRREG